MFPADDADFDLDLGEQFGGTLGEIPAAFGLELEAVPLQRGAPERPKKADTLRGPVFLGSELEGPRNGEAPPSGESGAKRRSRCSAGHPWPAGWVSR